MMFPAAEFALGVDDPEEGALTTRSSPGHEDCIATYTDI
jgi:hypothetical protein